MDRQANLRRLLFPRTIAVVGARDSVPNAGVRRMLDAGRDVFLVNPVRDCAYGHPTVPSLAAIPSEIDAILALTGIAQAGVVAGEAVRLGAGGMVIYASGYEPGEARGLLNDAGAAGLAIMGPNSNGFINASDQVYLAGTPPLDVACGGIGLITHSGGLQSAIANGLRARNAGMSMMISAGNEWYLDLVDYLDLLIDDPSTRVVALIVEQIRRPAQFFAAARRARLAGKPIVALKLGRSQRGQAIARSHTGAIAGEAWVYEAAFRQHGVIPARDVPDLLDLVSVFARSSGRPIGPIRRPAIVTTSGGMAQLASDICEEEGLTLPAFPELTDALGAVMAKAGDHPQDVIANPFDTGGALAGRGDLLATTLRTFVDAGADCLVFVWLLDQGAGGPASTIVDALAALARSTALPVFLCSVEDGELGDWTKQIADLTVCRGIRPAVRGLSAIDAFAGYVPDSPLVREDAEVARPASFVASAAGRMLGFAETMRLLEQFQIPVAPYVVWADGEEPVLPRSFDGPFAVKLADVPHRTEIGGVRLNVPADGLADAVRALRRLAADQGLPGSIAIQPMQSILGEAFVGGMPGGDLGPVILCNAGGTMVELLGKGAARLAPFGLREAAAMISEINPAIVDGFRSGKPWDRDGIAKIVSAVSQLVYGCRDWLGSIDINPLVLTEAGFVAVDGLCIAKDDR